MRRFLSSIAGTGSLVVALLVGLPSSSAFAMFLMDAGPTTAVVTPPNPPTAAATDATVTRSHLPAWVQVIDPSAAIFANDQGADQAGPKLGRYTFLRVLSAGASRLQVEAIDPDSGQTSQRGWVNPDAVAPSASGQNWLVVANPTTLWRTADPAAESSRGLDRFTALQQTDGPVQGRIEVRVFSGDFSKVLDRGWISVDDTGPALPPQIRVPDPTRQASTSSVSAGAWGTVQQQAFLDAAASAARAGQAQTGVPASVTVAQAILESDWGRSGLAQSASNYFGVKALGSLGTDGVVWMPTAEYDANGNVYQTLSPFRAYKSLDDSLLDHDLLLKNLSRYAPAMQVANDPRQFAHMLVQGGYATDPSYADKLIALMDRYDLYRLDS